MQSTRLTVAALVALAGTCTAQTCEWNAADGNWSNPANWNPQDVPDQGGEIARIGIGGVYTVTLDMSPTIWSAEITNPDATLHLPSVVLTVLDSAGLTNWGTVRGYTEGSIVGNITNYGLFTVRGYNQGLSLHGPTVMNHGEFVVNPEHNGYYGDLRFVADTALGGAGVVRLDYSSAYMSTGGEAVVTQGVGHRIAGRGVLRAALVNQGAVEADVGGETLTVSGAAKVNHALMRAVDGGTLLATGVAIDQTGGGVLRAEDGSVVRLTNAVITGGTLDSSGTGFVEHRDGHSTLTGLTNQGLCNLIGYNLYTYINGAGLHNDGSVVVNSNQNGFFASLRYTQSGVLDGSGTVTLNHSSAWLESVEGVTVTHAAGHTIDGGGHVSAALTNDGTVRANRPGTELLVDGYAKTNRGEMLAADGATLRISGATIDQTGGGVLRAEDGSRVVLQDALIAGGTLASAGTGYVEARDGHSTLRGVTNSGTLLLKGYNLYTYVDGDGLHNNGLVVVDYDLNGYFASLYYTASGLLDGVGTVTLAHPSARIESADGVVVWHGPMHTINGGGSVRAMIDNGGVIAATDPANELVLDGRAKTNRADMFATAGATMRVRGIEIDQTGGGLLGAEDGSRVVLENALIVGGTLDSIDAGYVETRDGHSTLRGVTNEGRLLLKGYNLYTYVDGDGLHNNGEVVVNHDQNGYYASLRFTESGVLDGPGLVRLNHSSAFLETAPGVTMTHGASHTIRGWGTLSAATVNHGLIDADDPSGELVVNGGGIVNHGVMRSDGGGTLRLSVAVDQTPGGTIRADDGGRTLLVGAQITGGTLATSGSGFIEHRDGDSWLTGVTNAGLLRLQGYNRSTYLAGGLINDGEIVVNYNDSGYYASLYATEPLMIDGVGTITLYGQAGGTYLQTAGGVTGTIGHGQRVTGRGTVYGSWVSHGTLAPGLAAGTMQAVGTLVMAGDATLAVEVASTSVYDRLDGSAEITLGGTLDVSHIDGYAPGLWDEFAVVRGLSVGGEFDAITGDPLPGAWVYKVRYEPASAVLIVTCPPDSNADGEINTLDFLVFLNLWTAHDPEADWNGDGAINTLDFLAYLNDWSGGCA